MKMALGDLSNQIQYFYEKRNITIDVYFPVKEHREAFLKNPNINLLVAYDPIDENAQVTAFYPNGSKVYPSSDHPPNIPTLVVAISEGRFKRTNLITSVEECDLNTAYMKYIKVYDIKEPWFKGDPEIYCWIVYENGFKKKLFWPEIKRNKTECYLDCRRPIIDQWRKDEFEHVAFIWYEQDVKFPVKHIKIKLPWGSTEIEIGDIVIDRDDEMGSEIADWDAVPCSPYDSGKLYNTGIVEFKIAGKSNCAPKIVPTTPTPKMTPILEISAPKFAYVGEVVNITVYSYCYIVDHQPLICTFSLNPIPNATVEIKKDGVIVKTGKTDENGTFRTVFDEAGKYTIVASKEGYIPATTKLVVYETPTPTPEESTIEQIAVQQITAPELT